MSANKKFYKITGVVYDTEPQYAHWDTKKQYPRYDEITSVDFGIREFESLDAAEEWFTTNYPCLKAGGCIQRVTEDGKPMERGEDIAFVCFAVKGAES